MNRLILLATLASACAEQPLPMAPPPNLVASRSATSLIAAPIQLASGEAMVWGVTWRGVRVGTAELDVLERAGVLRIESRFRTEGIAEQMHPVHHSLVTTFGETGIAARESPDDLHAALGRVRSWVGRSTAPASLQVRHKDQLFAVKFAQPVLDSSLSRPALRIEAEARSPDRFIELTLWFSADQERDPMAMSVSQGGHQVHARLIDVPSSTKE